MKIKIEIVEDLKEEEIIIKCRKVDHRIQDIQQKITETIKKPELVLYTEKEEYYIPLEDVCFFETSDNSVHAHTAGDSFKTKFRLYELEELLTGDFIRVSKSAIVNVKQILSLKRNLPSPSLIEFYNSHKQIYVSRFFYKSLKERLKEKRR